MLPLLRATHLAPSVAVTGFAAALAASARPGPRVALIAAATLAGQFSIGWANDWVDRDRDRLVGRRDKPIAAGLVAERTVGRAAVAALVACVPLSLATGLVAGATHLLAVALGWTYDLRLKSTAWSVLPYAGAFGLLPVFVARGATGVAGPWWAGVGGALLGAGAHFVNALPDLAQDARTGVRGLPQRLGPGGSLTAAVILLGLGVLVVGLAPGGPVTGVRLASLLAGLATVAAALTAGLRGRPRLAFPFAIGTAAAVVVAFIAAGEQLG